MPRSAFHEESDPAEPLPALTGLDGWPHLRYHYVVRSDGAPAGLRLEVAMAFDPPPFPAKPAEEASGSGNAATADAAPGDDPRAVLLARYREIGAQWEAENTVELEASFCVGSLPSASLESAAACLRQNARAIIAALEAESAADPIVAPDLGPLSFALPDPVSAAASYASAVLQPLAVTLRFRTEATAQPGGEATAATSADADTPAVAVLTAIPPRPDDTADATAPSYRTLAAAVETAFAALGWRVVQGEESAADDAGLAVLRWQVKDGVQFTLSEPDAAGRAGFACPPLTAVVPSRADISAAQLPPAFPARYAGGGQWALTDFDLEAELARFLDAVETFLTPERRLRMGFFESASVKRAWAAKEALADLLAARVAAIAADATGPAARDAAQAALRAACRADLRSFDRVGAVALWQADVEAPLPFVVHGRFVPADAAAIPVLGGSVPLTAKSNPLALPICARAADGASAVELAGSFCAEAIAPVDEAGREGAKLHFVTDAGTTVTAPPLRARLPWRSLPMPPRVHAQIGVAGEGDTVEAAKLWRLQCDYSCDPVSGDMLRWNVEFEASPASPRAGGGRRPDLLDTLGVFQMKVSAILEEVDRSLPSPVHATTVRADAPIRDAIRAFVLLMEWVAGNFVPPAEFQKAPDLLRWGRDVASLATGSVTVGPFDIARISGAQVVLQIQRNADTALAPAFRYATRVVRPVGLFTMLIERTLPIDIRSLPPLGDSVPGDPPPGSRADSLVRLLEAAVSAPGPKAGLPSVWLRVAVEFARRLPGPSGLESRVPVTMMPFVAFSSDRRPDEIRRAADAIESQLESWLSSQGLQLRGDALAGARFLFDLTLGIGNDNGAPLLPILHVSELYFPCAAD